MKYLIPVLVLVCGLAAIPAAAIDQVEKGVTVTDSEQTADALLEQADEIFQQRDYQAALDKYMEVIETARAQFNRSVEAEAMAQAARMNLLLGNKEVGREWLADAAEKTSDADPMGWSRYLGVRGRFEWKDDNLVEARQTFETMYNYCTVNALYGRAVDAAHMIAIVAATPDEQIEWGRRGIEAAEAADAENWLGPLWNNLGATYFDRQQYDSALECYQKARDYHWQYSGEVAKLFADYHVGMTYRFLGQYDEAGQWLRPVLAWAERLDNQSAIGQACEDLGEIAAAQGNKVEALKLLKRARDCYKAEGFDESWPEIWENINTRISQVEGN
ncbi:MAG TPA: tetratricopeptide repeat protein [candidate division Zixibacteria bacterium]|nr:tetratricopeptide repeat protein [candidate division Zixibacteria bacterium]